VILVRPSAFPKVGAPFGPRPHPMDTRTIRLSRKTALACSSLLSGCALLLVASTSSVAGTDLLASVPASAAVHPSGWPTAPPALTPDPRLEARISQILASMTLEQKVGQLIQADIGSVTPQDIRQFPLGSILNGGNSSPGNNEFAPPSEWLALADRFYDASMDPSHGTHPIPMLWGTDAVHGHNKVIGATIFPHNIALGAARDPELVRQIGEITAQEIRVTGLDWTFSPMLAVTTDPRWGRTYESFSEDPQIVREYASQMVLGLQGVPGSRQFLDSVHVIATAKHFLGDGGTAGRDEGDNLSSETELRDVHFAGYPPAISAGVQSVMVSFSSWQGMKMHAQTALLSDILKARLHFDGLVIGDWNGHGQVPGCTNASCAVAINAGIDVLMAPDSWKLLLANTVSDARSGKISAARIADAVRRVLRVKLRAQLLEEGRPSSRPLAGRFELLGAPEHRAVARRAVRESLVLLKNENHLLPLAPGQRVLVAGDGADNISKQSGGWTLTWQGGGVSNRYFPHAESIYAGIRAAVASGGGTTELSPTGSFALRPDVAIVVFGENPYAEYQGDVRSLEYSPNDKRDLQLLHGLRAQGIPVISLFLSGRPLWVNPEINASSAFVAAWLPGSEGGGIADVILKAPDGSVQHDFHGKLSFSWPHTLGQSGPGQAGPARAPLFAYGYGLRYADDGNVKKLSEEPAVTRSSHIDTRSYFVAGRLGDGWRWVTTEGNARSDLPEGVGVTRVGYLQISAGDKASQEDARKFEWTGFGAASVGLAAGARIDLQHESANRASLTFDFTVDRAPSGAVSLEMECDEGCRGIVPLAGLLSAAPPKSWSHARIPLVCFGIKASDLKRITMPFEIRSAGSLAMRVTNIRLENPTRSAINCPR
jgi:beta-glucosidase